MIALFLMRFLEYGIIYIKGKLEMLIYGKNRFVMDNVFKLQEKLGI